MSAGNPTPSPLRFRICGVNMFRPSFLSVLAFVAVALAAPSLLLEVSGPSNVHGVDNLNITTTVKNAGDEVVRLLNHPRGPLSDLPTDMFTITNRHGLSPDFVGITVSDVVLDGWVKNAR